MQKINLLLGVIAILSCTDCQNSPKKNKRVDNGRGELEKVAKTYGQFAPDDAFEEDPYFAYYGSENEWTRRQFREISADKLYKRRGQRQLLAIIDGKPDSALVYCERRLSQDPADPEIHYMMTVAYSSKNDTEKAVQSMNLALKNGLPFERFVAGPKDILAPLYQTKAYKGLQARFNVRLIHGPMLGNVTPYGASFWVRTANESDVMIKCINPKSGKVISGHSRTAEAKDNTTVVRVDGLKPNTKYNYSVWIGGDLIKEGYHVTTTQSTKYKKPFSIAFGGCAGYTPSNERMWDTLATHDLKALLLLGDNVYIDLPGKPNQVHDYTYYRRQSRPEFRRLVSKVPVYSIWDDHDAAIDDVWMGPYKDKPYWKIPMVNLFINQWNNPGYATGDWPGGWYKFSISDIDLIMLDDRTYRTNPFKSEKTMLGPVQKKWLFESLKNSKATFKLIVSSVPWALGAKPGSHDTWAGFEPERNEIFQFLTDNNIEGVILLSADRHRTDFWKNEREGDYPLYEFMSSRLTNIHTHDLVPGAIFGYNEKCAFGKMTFNTTLNDPEIRFEIINIDNEPIYSYVLKRSELK
mgnify:CR=1 FL=1|tara:strand:+ start:27519 stop:29252 length:1734 start_codon:yes stop_codon:yes gene_type:complete